MTGLESDFCYVLAVSRSQLGRLFYIPANIGKSKVGTHLRAQSAKPLRRTFSISLYKLVNPRNNFLLEVMDSTGAQRKVTLRASLYKMATDEKSQWRPLFSVH